MSTRRKLSVGILGMGLGMKEFGVSRRTVARDLDFLRDEEYAPLAYDNVRHGFRLTDETYTLPPGGVQFCTCP